MQTLNTQFHNVDKVDNSFWREIGVKADAIVETDPILLSNKIRIILNSFKMPALTEICDLFDVKKSGEDDVIDLLCSLPIEDRQLILFLYDFSNRKKKTINNYYDYLGLETKHYTKSSLAKLIHLYKLGPTKLIEIFTWYLWDNRASGKLFMCNKAVPVSIAKKIANEHTFHVTLRDSLYKGSGSKNFYRVFSNSVVNNRILILLYRLISDAPRADFVSAPRNREVSPSLFLIDLEKGTVEIKSLTTEESSIKKYLEETLGCSLEPIQAKVFTDYKREVFLNSIIKGSTSTAIGEPVKDFTVFKVKFRNTPLKNSPQITLELDGLDIWPSVEEAYECGTINLESLKDLESMHFKSTEGSRIIKSTILDNGNIIFSMDDSNLDIPSKQVIEKKFQDKFGVPLYREISNEQFDEGKADKIDYLLTAVVVEKPSPYERILISELKNLEILEEHIKKYYYCENCQIEYSFEDKTEIPNQCIHCDSQILKTKTSATFKSNIKEIYKYTKNILRSSNSRWIISRENELNLVDTQLKCIHLKNTQNQDKNLQVVFVEKSLRKSVLKYLNRLMKPTILILIGQQEKTIDYNNYSCVESLNFGKIYIEGEQEFLISIDKMFESLERRTKTFISAAAQTAFNAISSLSEDQLNKKEYTDKMFEDHVFSLLKEMFPNAEKWGKEMSGKEVPEGLFTISYRDNIQNRAYQYVFSYDCKLNTNGKGYDLNISEQRKAVQYVNDLNQNDYIQAFSHKNQVSGHIFISNRFRKNNFETMTKHFYDQLDDGFDSQAVFLDVEILCYLYEKYCKYYDKLNASRNIYSRNLFNTLLSQEITKSSIDNVFKRAIDEDLAEYKLLSTDKITEELKR